MPCPCDPSRDYATCCAPFHTRSQMPARAEQLMRSRYSAYVLQDADYLIYSHHPKQHRRDDRSSLQNLFESLVWQGLEILATRQGGPEDAIGKVEFKAHYLIGTEAACMHERSRFRRYAGRWVYWDGQTLTA